MPRHGKIPRWSNDTPASNCVGVGPHGFTICFSRFCRCSWAAPSGGTSFLPGCRRAICAPAARWRQTILPGARFGDTTRFAPPAPPAARPSAGRPWFVAATAPVRVGMRDARKAPASVMGAKPVGDAYDLPRASRARSRQPPRRPPPVVPRRDRRRADGDARRAGGARIQLRRRVATSSEGRRAASTPVARVRQAYPPVGRSRPGPFHRRAVAQPARPWRECAERYFRVPDNSSPNLCFAPVERV